MICRKGAERTSKKIKGLVEDSAVEDTGSESDDVT